MSKTTDVRTQFMLRGIKDEVFSILDRCLNLIDSDHNEFDVKDRLDNLKRVLDDLNSLEDPIIIDISVCDDINRRYRPGYCDVQKIKDTTYTFDLQEALGVGKSTVTPDIVAFAEASGKVISRKFDDTLDTLIKHNEVDVYLFTTFVDAIIALHTVTMGYFKVVICKVNDKWTTRVVFER
jgi:hypothetical protein